MARSAVRIPAQIYPHADKTQRQIPGMGVAIETSQSLLTMVPGLLKCPKNDTRDPGVNSTRDLLQPTPLCRAVTQ